MNISEKDRKWQWGAAPLQNPVFSRWCPSKKSIYRGGNFLGGGGALFRSSLWFIGMWFCDDTDAQPGESAAETSTATTMMHTRAEPTF
jgi:hypothetical protein